MTCTTSMHSTRRCVHFDEDPARVHPSTLIQDEIDRRACWYNASDYARFQNEAKEAAQEIIHVTGSSQCACPSAAMERYRMVVCQLYEGLPTTQIEAEGIGSLENGSTAQNDQQERDEESLACFIGLERQCLRHLAASQSLSTVDSSFPSRDSMMDYLSCVQEYLEEESEHDDEESEEAKSETIRQVFEELSQPARSFAHKIAKFM
eukprot:CAMPEP_0172449520 /NCGR_PEP_ID=MMETSP1065-20121228/8209_1 /TAXON_ID=265537 /ORGANISM="Amphiprora paludosa, Strain CCMP125" /LENGTH=205 /DNA_ID=CAMNT_0013201209 /DNA_START=11 /DNA_END=625 /DNA_ORIENTATION=+